MYSLPNCHLSELDVDVDGASLEVQLLRDDTQKTKQKEERKPQAKQSRYRRPIIYSVERYRHEGDSGVKNDSSSADSPRGRSRSSTFTPTRTRAPTPHPHAHGSKPRQEKDFHRVRFTDPMEQQSRVRKGKPATAPPEKKSAMKREPKGQQKKEKDRAEESLEAHATHQIEVIVTPNEFQLCNSRRDKRSSIPTPKFAVSRSMTSRPIIPPECLPSPLITQADTAALRLSQRRSRIPTISSPALAPAVTTSENHIPTAARDSAFDNIPKVRGTVDCRSAPHQSRHTSMTKPLPTQSSFHSAKIFWTEKSASDHATSKPKLSTFTGSAACSISSYHTANSCLSETNNSDISTNTPSMTASSTSVAAQYVPSLQSEFWNELINFCRSESSSVTPGERYCDCDDCVWRNEKDLKECSTVARTGAGRKCRARKE